jgi:signal transduction histidine kinase
MSPALGRTESNMAQLRAESVSGMAEISDGESRPPAPLAVLMARAIIVAVTGLFCLVALLYVIEDPSLSTPGMLTLAAGYLIALLGLQVLHFSRPGTRLRSPLSYSLLAVQACLAYLPILQFGSNWIGIPSLLAGTALLVLPAIPAWTLFTATVVSTGWIHAALSGSNLDSLYIGVATVMFGLELYGLTRLAGLIAELHKARTELAWSAVAHERLRFARDLHELLGLRLSAIAPKGELAHRLVAKDTDRARQELSEILEISRRALADVRSVARGYRDQNLEEASRTAGSVLAAASVDVRMLVKHGELPVRIRSLMAAVLREGATNVLQHSVAERCEITLTQTGDQLSLDMINDGILDLDAAAGPHEGDGGGLGTLAEQVAALDGELTAGLDEDGRFRLHLSVPVAPDQKPPAEAEPAEEVSRGAIQRAIALVAVVFCGLLAQATLRIAFLTNDDTKIQLAAGYMSVLVALQLLYFVRPGTRLRSPKSYAILPLQAALVFTPLVQFGVAWVALPGFLLGSVLLVLPPRLGWTVFALIVGVIGAAAASQPMAELGGAFSVVGAVVSGLVVYGLSWMVRSMAELRAARLGLARAAVAEERLRFARDLHDLLGLSLSAITLKSELAHRLVTADPARAREELTEILSISRLALADVRSVAGGQQELSLAEESRTAESLLVAAEVDVRMNLRYGELPAQVGTVLATVLREGVTNVLRHSKGEYCEITVRQQDHSVLLDIINDGVTETPELSSRNGGSGLGNLSARVGMIGGELTAGVCPDGRFRLHARVPL